MNSFGLVAAVGVCLGGAAAYALLRRRQSPDELERQRRDLLVQQGRIIDATVIDISDLNRRRERTAQRDATDSLQV